MSISKTNNLYLKYMMHTKNHGSLVSFHGFVILPRIIHPMSFPILCRLKYKG